MLRLPFHKLTPQQIECLRLVSEGLTSKAIARRLGLTPTAIDDRIERAMATLAAANRRQAARWLAEYEGREAPEFRMLDTPESTTPEPQTIAQGTQIDMLATSFNGTERDAEVRDRSVREEQQPFNFDVQFRTPDRVPLPFRRSPHNDLTIAQRLVWVLAIALGIMLATGAFLGGLDALARIFGSLASKS